MIMLDVAKMHCKKTMDSAFTKKIGTKKTRAAMANICTRMCPTSHNDSLALNLWAVDYAKNWEPEITGETK